MNINYIPPSASFQPLAQTAPHTHKAGVSSPNSITQPANVAPTSSPVDSDGDHDGDHGDGKLDKMA